MTAPEQPKPNMVLALTALWASRPGLNAPAEQVAAWYQAKGRTHELLAREAATRAERAEAEANALAAYEHANRLLLDASPRPAGAEAEAVMLAEQADRVALVGVA
jgi:hypothetical protein